jgi:hypothetical protein
VSSLVITKESAALALRELAVGGVDQAENAMLSHEQADCPVVHRFGPGVYIRELRMAAGVLAVGHRQKQQHMNVLIKGRVLMLQEDGSTAEIAAPLTFVGQPGRKMGYVLEDVIWQNIYATDVTDVPTLESMFLDKSQAWEETAVVRARAAHAQATSARDDFHRMLDEYDISAGTVHEQSVSLLDQTPMPFGAWLFKTGHSPIHGTGIFMTADAEAGYVVGPARVYGMRTPLGRYTNHSHTPNARMDALPNGDIRLVLIKAVRGCRGGEDGEEVTIDYRQALSLSGVTSKRTLV